MKPENLESLNLTAEVKRLAEQAHVDEKARQMLDQMSLLAGLPTSQLLLAYIRFLPDVIKAHLAEKRKKQ